MDGNGWAGSGDPFLSRHDSKELRQAAEFLATWLPFISSGLCPGCATMLSDRIRSIGPGVNSDARTLNPDEKALVVMTPDVKLPNKKCGHSSGSSNNAEGTSTSRSGKRAEAAVNFQAHKTEDAEASALRSQAMESDMEEEDGVQKCQKLDGELMINDITILPLARKTKSSREVREHIRFMKVKIFKELVFFERVNGRQVNILDGLELHTEVFSAVEQKRIVKSVNELQEKGRRGELKERTYTAPAKSMRGKGCETIQFGCYSVDKNANQPDVLHDELVDPLPSLFKSMIKRLIRWHILPLTNVPDSCIVSIYEEGDCIPPQIYNHDFARPFCTASFLSECKILFGSSLKVLGPSEFEGPISLDFLVGSVLVLNGNGADIAKHCVPALPMKWISVTFGRVDECKRPSNYLPEPELLGIKPLPYKPTGPVRRILEKYTTLKLL